MKLHNPLNPLQVTQPFARNFNTYYAEGGLRGHSGIDYACKYKQDIFSACDGYCYSVLNQNNPDLMRYRAVYIFVESPLGYFEVSYGHAMDIFVKKGTMVKTGDLLMNGGNTGDVASGGKKVTREQKLAGSTAGTHLHFQVRKLYLADTYNPTTDTPLYDGWNVLMHNGKYVLVENYNNGYNGCIDPTPFFGTVEPEKFVFTRLLRRGSRGNDVKELQKLLKIGSDGIFGAITDRAVRDFQRKNNLTVDGIVGRKTLAVLTK
jgi:murein DD-endopeptidase MepM/ murein hydrolase activator NlpD